ncbi:ATP-binding protein [Streptomyces kunmingensis]|uniref:ATP-binding protein n=1 Tax=Streptomyces kunmingensis TaxID=68225 RepID=A0ABU6CKK7_9ACTN|nr:ATP-binding protein [Streptomyces kunmingensis]MEB3965243.1 ATP-binding protein [Streptomyces kunmingensis]
MQTTGRPAPALPQDIEWRLPRHARSVGRVRALFREQAASWALSDDVTDTAELLLSELTTNAYRHAKAPAGREIWARAVLTNDPGRLLRLLVTDAGESFAGPGPAPQLPALKAESGRGLVLVQALADAWGSEPRPRGPGKTVWCELRLEQE